MTALIINDPPSLKEALCLLECFEPMGIAAQSISIADAVRVVEARRISQQQGLLHPLHSLQLLQMV